jgi:Co/Zn/Cd efflux system component
MFNNLSQHRAILIVALLNFGYFFVEFFVALNITSVSLFADSIDFLEDAFTNFIILFGLYLSLQNRIKLGYLLIGMIFIPSLFTLIFAINQFLNPVLTDGVLLSSYAFGALVINIFCAFLIARFKKANNSLVLTAFYSARNDALANIAMIIAGVITIYTTSHYPDLIVGILIFLLNLDASKAIYEQIKKEKTK